MQVRHFPEVAVTQYSIAMGLGMVPHWQPHIPFQWCRAPGGIAWAHKGNGYKVSKENWNTFWLQNHSNNLILRVKGALTANLFMCTGVPVFALGGHPPLCVPFMHGLLLSTPVLTWRPVPNRAASLSTWMNTTETSTEISHVRKCSLSR